jgi:uncharacterized protein (TIGR03435 family)
MKALLEDRFKLKIHRETSSIPVYALSVAKGGHRLHAAQSGSCMTVNRDHPFSPPAEEQPMPRDRWTAWRSGHVRSNDGGSLLSAVAQAGPGSHR